MLHYVGDTLTFEPDRCCQCGVCLPSCGPKALSAFRGEKQFAIAIDTSQCTNCGVCVDACPAGLLPSVAVPSDAVARARSLHLACAADPGTRKRSSSGGFTRTVIGQALRSRLIDAVYTLVYPQIAKDKRGALRSIPSEAEGRWLRRPPDPDSIPCSLYRPVLWGQNLVSDAPRTGRVLLVGLPCQLKGAYKLLRRFRPQLKVTSIAIFCRKNKEFGYTRFYERLARLEEKNCERAVTYRGNGWPGNVTVYGRDVSAHRWVFPAASWTLKACEYCLDCTNAQQSDITVLDPWGIAGAEQSQLGQTVVLVWTDEGQALLDDTREMLEVSALGVDQASTPFNYRAIARKRDAVFARIDGKRRPHAGAMKRLRSRLAELVLERFPRMSRFLFR